MILYNLAQYNTFLDNMNRFSCDSSCCYCSALAGAIISICYATKCTAVTKVGSIIKSVREHL